MGMTGGRKEKGACFPLPLHAVFHPHVFTGMTRGDVSSFYAPLLFICLHRQLSEVRAVFSIMEDRCKTYMTKVANDCLLTSGERDTRFQRGTEAHSSSDT